MRVCWTLCFRGTSRQPTSQSLPATTVQNRVWSSTEKCGQRRVNSQQATGVNLGNPRCKKPRRQSPARPACSARTTGTFLSEGVSHVHRRDERRLRGYSRFAACCRAVAKIFGAVMRPGKPDDGPVMKPQHAYATQLIFVRQGRSALQERGFER